MLARIRESLRCDRPVAVLGDIHGRADLLARMLDAVGDRELLVVGDVCDRGPSTREVITRLCERGARGVFGNHELWLRQWANGEGFAAYALSAAMGGAATLASYGIDPTDAEAIDAAHAEIPAAHVEWLNGLKAVLDVEVDAQRYTLVHAGVPHVGELEAIPEAERVDYMLAHRPDDLLWRKNFPQRVTNVGSTVVMGHFALTVPVDLGHVVAIDTGAGTLDGGALTALLLPERQFVTVRS